MNNTISKFKQLKWVEPLDKAAWILITVLTVLIGIVLLTGDRTTPQVKEFSWQNKQIGAEDMGLLLTFNRPMNRESVEKNFQIDPPLPGKISWAGRRMAYTLSEPVPYGTPFSVQLKGARDHLYGDKLGTLIQPFNGFFRSRDRAFAYIGVQENQEGKLVLVNLSEKEPKPIILTPEDLVVLDFKIYPKGDKILFSAINKSEQKQGSISPELYTVATGINPQSPGEDPEPAQPVGKIEKILDAKYYRNLKFDLSPDGKIIVVQRVSQTNPNDASPWFIESGKSPKPLNIQGGDFLIAPDSQSLVIAQGPDLTTILPLKPDAKPLEFLPKFGRVLGFANDGSAAAMLKFNPDGTRSLFIVNNQGQEQELYRTPPFGNIVSAEFDPSNSLLYSLITEVLDNPEVYKEQPYIVAIDIKTKQVVPFVILPNQQEINISLSPDGLALLFDQTVIGIGESNDSSQATKTQAGDTIKTSRIWILPLMIDTPTDGSKPQVKPEELPFFGFHPQWLP